MRAVARDEVKVAFRRANATASAMPGTDQFQKFAAAEYARFGQPLRERNFVLQEQGRRGLPGSAAGTGHQEQIPGVGSATRSV